MCYLVLYILRFLFHLFLNRKPSLVSLSLNFIFCTHCPASSSLACCGQRFCNIIFLLIKFVVVVVIYNNSPRSLSKGGLGPVSPFVLPYCILPCAVPSVFWDRLVSSTHVLTQLTISTIHNSLHLPRWYTVAHHYNRPFKNK